MDPITIFVVGMASGALIGTAMGSVNYRLGVNDGYMFAKEPTCPGYQRARRILEKYGKISVDAGNVPKIHAKDAEDV